MNEKELIKKNICRCFKANENRKVVILPLRNLSGMVRDILSEEFGLKEQFLVDNYAYDMKHIYPVDQMPEGYEDCLFFLAVFGSTKKVLKNQLLKYVSEDQIVDLLFDEEREQVFNSSNKVHIDFLCPGFAKCGTTSLHYAFAQNPKIFLPQVKETYFLRYSVNENTHESFKKHYKAEETEGKFVGDIEPTYIYSAEEVYNYFGSNIKLIFCVRNPVSTLYSHFKMAFRNEIAMLDANPQKLEMMKEFEHVCPEMFDKYAAENRRNKLYADYIKAFLEYYPMEQIKIIVCEELYADAYGVMDDLQNFLGIPEEAKLEYKEFPRENIGSKVSKDQISLEINISIKQLHNRLVQKGDFQSLALLDGVCEKIEEITLVDYNEAMLESTRKDLTDYYMDSIHELEGMLGRSLQGIWY